MYSGTYECASDQRVHIIYNKTTTHLEEKTGNPVLWNHNGITYLLYSKFEKMNAPTIHKWKHCSLWLRTLFYHNKQIILQEPIQISTPQQHLLGRCTPIEQILPLYNEVNMQGTIIDLKQSTEVIGTIGTNMIQPCLWKENDTYHTLSRNFKNYSQSKAKHSYSADLINWTTPTTTTIPNNNSSLCTINWNNKQLLLWNNTHRIKRTNLTLGTIQIKNGTIQTTEHTLISQYGSYPSMCIDKYNRLHITYTNRKREITHNTWNWKHYQTRIKNRP